MKRIIKDYKTAGEELLMKLNALYPNGISDSDVIVFINAKGEKVRAVEVRTDDTIFLVKMSQQLQDKLEDFDMEADDYDQDQSEMDLDMAAMEDYDD